MAGIIPGLSTGGGGITAPVGPSYSQTGAVSVGGVTFPPKQPENPVSMIILGAALIAAAWIIARRKGG